MNDRIVRSVDYDTVDKILQKHIGNYTNETEQNFYQLNPHVLDQGVVLPAGIVMKLPAHIQSVAIKRGSIWD